MRDLGTCEMGCGRPAVVRYHRGAVHHVTGERTEIVLPTCADCAETMATPCVIDRCADLPVTVLLMSGTGCVSGEHHDEQVGFCSKHADEFEQSRVLHIDGRTMVRDPNTGRVKALPETRGQG